MKMIHTMYVLEEVHVSDRDKRLLARILSSAIAIGCAYIQVASPMLVDDHEPREKTRTLNIKTIPVVWSRHRCNRVHQIQQELEMA